MLQAGAVMQRALADMDKSLRQYKVSQAGAGTETEIAQEGNVVGDDEFFQADSDVKTAIGERRERAAQVHMFKLSALGKGTISHPGNSIANHQIGEA
jgi:hypothetical protein